MSSDASLFASETSPAPRSTGVAGRWPAVILLLALAGCGGSTDPVSRAAAAPLAPPVERGGEAYAARCALCHGSSGEGGQGPDLRGVVGRRIASTGYAYSRALRGLDGDWNVPRLDGFLTAPQRIAPGSSMAANVTEPATRADLIAYLGSLAPVPGADAARAATGAAPASSAFGGWREDAPGREHHIAPGDLPPPRPETSVGHRSEVVDRPAGALPQVPPGFEVGLYAENLKAPRALRTAPNGDVFVSESGAGRIRVLRPDASGARATAPVTYADGLDEPFGLAFYPADSPQWLYVAESNRILRYSYRAGDTQASARPQVVLGRISPSSGGHSARDLAISRDGAWLYVGVGSASNVADRMSRKSVAEARAWEKGRAPGALWDEEEGRAQVLALTPDGAQAHAYATGIRNCSGLAVQPSSGALWCSTNERDRLGNDLVPDYVTRVAEGGFYGWPWYYIGDRQDPRLADQRPDLRGQVKVPDVLLQPHSASLGISFAEGAKLPADWKGSAFAAEHGSWNRLPRTGSKLIRIPVDAGGAPTGRYEDVMTGFVLDEERVWGRLVGVAVARDGALLVSDDAGGVIWRLAYRGD